MSHIHLLNEQIRIGKMILDSFLQDTFTLKSNQSLHYLILIQL